jgi:D-alanine transaminase
MPRIAYVNGRYTPHADASVHVEDRGYQFADGVYEVCEVARGNIMDMTRHLDRLDRSLRELRIDWPIARRALEFVMREVVRRNHVENGLVYLQVTRGVAPRDHYFPAAGTQPALVVTAKRSSPTIAARRAAEGVKVITVPENRWERVDIKTVGLLPNVLARQKAREAGAVEAWFIDTDGTVKEGASTNAWIVTADGTLVTRPAEFGILRGITRATVMDVAKKLGLKVEERSFSVDEAKGAKEAFITAATTVVMPVVDIDGASVANGHPGSVTLSLREAFFDIAEKTPA